MAINKAAQFAAKPADQNSPKASSRFAASSYLAGAQTRLKEVKSISARVKDLASDWAACLGDDEDIEVVLRFYSHFLDMMQAFDECYLFECLASADDPIYRQTKALEGDLMYPALSTTTLDGWRIRLEDCGSAMVFDVRPPSSNMKLSKLSEFRSYAAKAALVDASSVLVRAQPVWYWRQRAQAWLSAVVTAVDPRGNPPIYQVRALDEEHECDTQRHLLRPRITANPPLTAPPTAAATRPNALVRSKAEGAPEVAGAPPVVQHQPAKAEVQQAAAVRAVAACTTAFGESREAVKRVKAGSTKAGARIKRKAIKAEHEPASAPADGSPARVTTLPDNKRRRKGTAVLDLT